MADYTEKIKFLEEETRKAYDAIFNKGNPGYQMNKYKTDTYEYERAKKEYDKVYPEYLKLKAKNDKLIAGYQKKLDVEEAAKKTGDIKHDTGGVLAKAKDEYARAQDSQDPERIASAAAALKAARTSYVTASENYDIANNIKPDINKDKDSNKDNKDNGSTEDKIYAGYSVDTTSGTVTQTINSAAVPLYLVTDASGKQTPYSDIKSAHDAYIKTYAATNADTEKLKQTLLAKHIITQKELEKNPYAWVDGIDYLIKDYTYRTVADVKYGKATSTPSINEYLNSGIKAPAGTTGSGTTVSYTSRGAAKQAIDAYAMDLRGSAATPEEADIYYKQLVDAERKAGTSGLIAAEDTMIAANVLRKSLQGTDVDTLLKTSNGSRVAIDIAALQDYATQYGVDMSAADALKYVAKGIGQKDYLAKQEERIRQLGMTLHPYLKDHIAAGGTVKDVADQYARVSLNKIGKVVASPTKDEKIMSAIAQGKTVDQFSRDLQGTTDWRVSDEANTIVDSFLGNLGRMWGRG